MELDILQDMWIQYDKKLSENTKLNKEILTNMLLSKTEKKLNWIKIKAVFSMILPIIAILFILRPRVEFRNDPDFYIGIILFGAISVVFYFWSVMYFLQINKIDFTKSITEIKKNVNKLEQYKFKITKFGYVLMPVGIIGIFLMGKIPIFSRNSILPFSLIVLVMIISIFYTLKYSIYQQFRALNVEIEEIEQLEK